MTNLTKPLQLLHRSVLIHASRVAIKAIMTTRDACIGTDLCSNCDGFVRFVILPLQIHIQTFKRRISQNHCNYCRDLCLYMHPGWPFKGIMTTRDACISTDLCSNCNGFVRFVILPLQINIQTFK